MNNTAERIASENIRVQAESIRDSMKEIVNTMDRLENNNRMDLVQNMERLGIGLEIYKDYERYRKIAEDMRDGI